MSTNIFNAPNMKQTRKPKSKTSKQMQSNIKTKNKIKGNHGIKRVNKKDNKKINTITSTRNTLPRLNTSNTLSKFPFGSNNTKRSTPKSIGQSLLFGPIGTGNVSMANNLLSITNTSGSPANQSIEEQMSSMTLEEGQENITSINIPNFNKENVDDIEMINETDEGGNNFTEVEGDMFDVNDPIKCERNVVLLIDFMNKAKFSSSKFSLEDSPEKNTTVLLWFTNTARLMDKIKEIVMLEHALKQKDTSDFVRNEKYLLKIFADYVVPTIASTIQELNYFIIYLCIHLFLFMFLFVFCTKNLSSQTLHFYWCNNI